MERDQTTNPEIQPKCILPIETKESRKNLGTRESLIAVTTEEFRNPDKVAALSTILESEAYDQSPLSRDQVQSHCQESAPDTAREKLRQRSTAYNPFLTKDTDTGELETITGPKSYLSNYGHPQTRLPIRTASTARIDDRPVRSQPKPLDYGILESRAVGDPNPEPNQKHNTQGDRDTKKRQTSKKIELSDVFGITRKKESLYACSIPCIDPVEPRATRTPAHTSRTQKPPGYLLSQSQHRKMDLDETVEIYKCLVSKYRSGSISFREFDLQAETGGLGLSYPAFQEVMQTLAGSVPVRSGAATSSAPDTSLRPQKSIEWDPTAIWTPLQIQPKQTRVRVRKWKINLGMRA